VSLSKNGRLEKKQKHINRHTTHGWVPDSPCAMLLGT